MALEDKRKIKGRWLFIKAKPTQKYKYDNGNYDFYRKYLIYKKQVRESNVLDSKKHTKIVNMFFEAVARKIISDGFIFYMPYGLGNIRINKVEYKGLPKQKSFFKSWNKHYTIQWDKESAKFKNKHMYHFKVRTFFQYLKYDKIERANEDPMETDMVGYNPYIKDKYNTSEVMRKKYTYHKAIEIKLPPKERKDMDDILKLLEK
jgi:hypothetical protein